MLQYGRVACVMRDEPRPVNRHPCHAIPFHPVLGESRSLQGTRRASAWCFAWTETMPVIVLSSGSARIRRPRGWALSPRPGFPYRWRPSRKIRGARTPLISCRYDPPHRGYVIASAGRRVRNRLGTGVSDVGVTAKTMEDGGILLSRSGLSPLSHQQAPLALLVVLTARCPLDSE